MNDSAIINVPELSPAEAQFVTLQRYGHLPWIRLSGVPRNSIERSVKRPKLSRYRAAMETAFHSHRVHRPVVISHHPMMTAAVSHALKAGNARARHIGFAFNFTELPSGRRLDYLRHAYRSVDRFIVFSEHEREVYASLFGIDQSRIVATLWTQGTPPVDDALSPFETPYMCAIGGEGRDLATLLRAAKLSGVPLAIVCRPGALVESEVPQNVKVFYNLPLAHTWGIAKQSRGVAVPLLSRDTCCGLVTIVSAQVLGLPLITTSAYSSAEYLHQARGVATCDPGDAEGLGHWLGEFMRHDHWRSEARDGASCAELRYARRLWTEVLEECIDDLGRHDGGDQ